MTKVLDHGYVNFIESWGSDERIIESARMSTDKGFIGWGPIHVTNCGMHPDFQHDEFTRSQGIEYLPSCTCNAKQGDEKLLRYLYEHKHHTPFEMAGMIIEVRAPIFVFREWHRHRTQSYNEMSARYIPLPDVNYIPTRERLQMTSATNKQAQGAQKVTNSIAENFISDLYEQQMDSERLYQRALKDGIPKELARLVIPVARYSKMRASANLRNWLAFLTLRMDENAQWEIQQYANVVASIISFHFPRTYELFMENR